MQNVKWDLVMCERAVRTRDVRHILCAEQNLVTLAAHAGKVKKEKKCRHFPGLVSVYCCVSMYERESISPIYNESIHAANGRVNMTLAVADVLPL